MYDTYQELSAIKMTGLLCCQVKTNNNKLQSTM